MVLWYRELVSFLKATNFIIIFYIEDELLLKKLKHKNDIYVTFKMYFFNIKYRINKYK